MLAWLNAFVGLDVKCAAVRERKMKAIVVVCGHADGHMRKRPPSDPPFLKPRCDMLRT